MLAGRCNLCSSHLRWAAPRLLQLLPDFLGGPGRQDLQGLRLAGASAQEVAASRAIRENRRCSSGCLFWASRISGELPLNMSSYISHLVQLNSLTFHGQNPAYLEES